jgi:hypothetical protein
MKWARLLVVALGLFLIVQSARADWGAAQRLTWNSGSSDYPAIAVDSHNHLHVVWHDDTPGNDEIYYRRSTDAGASWSASQRLTWNSGGSYNPVIAIDSTNHLYVAWTDHTPGNNEIYYRKSTDGGTTWSAVKRLTWTSGWSSYVALAIDSTSHLHVIWEDDTPGNVELYYKRSTDGGGTWSNAQRLTWTSCGSYYPRIAADSSGAIHVVWYENPTGNDEIYYKRSTNGGGTWGATQKLTWNSGYSFDPAIARSSSKTIHVVWDDSTPGNAEIYHKRSTDGGTTWSAIKRLTWTPGGSYYPAIDSGSSIYIVWEDTTPGNDEIYFAKSTDGGGTWSTAQRLTWISGESLSPALAFDSTNTVHVVWFDNTSGNDEIYYKKGK